MYVCQRSCCSDWHEDVILANQTTSMCIIVITIVLVIGSIYKYNREMQNDVVRSC